jgi:hypothetical protein
VCLSKGEEVTGGWGKMMDLKIYVILVIQKKDQVGGTCSLHAGKEKNIQMLGENMK